MRLHTRDGGNCRAAFAGYARTTPCRCCNVAAACDKLQHNWHTPAATQRRTFVPTCTTYGDDYGFHNNGHQPPNYQTTRTNTNNHGTTITQHHNTITHNNGHAAPTTDTDQTPTTNHRQIITTMSTRTTATAQQLRRRRRRPRLRRRQRRQWQRRRPLRRRRRPCW